MQNKNLILSVALTIIILAVIGGLYFTGKLSFNSESPSENVETPSGNNQEPTANLIDEPEFSMKISEGWTRVTPPQNVAAMVVNIGEEITDPEAQKIGFKTYYTASHDVLAGRTSDEYLEAAKGDLDKALPGITYTKEEDSSFDGQDASIVEAEVTQMGVNFKVLLVFIWHENENVWVLSFDTSKSNWDGYRDLFYSTAQTFHVK